MQGLYEIVREKRGGFNRTQAARYFKLWKTGSKAFGLFHSEMRKNKYDYSAIQSMLNNYRNSKEEYRRFVTVIPYSTYVVRRLWGQDISVQIANEGPDRFREAVKEIRDRVHEVRQRLQCHTIDDIFRRRDNCTSTGYWLKKYQAQIFQKTKRPTTNADFTGIEIECVMPANADFNALIPYAKWVNIGTDGSIDAGRNQTGQEIRVCIERENVREVLPGLTETLKNLGAFVNKSCGLHVHLDQRNEKQPELTFAKLVRSLGLLYRVVPASRRKNNYCKRNRRTDFNMAANGERYKAINATAYHRYKTLEVRLFGGTLDATKIINWIEILWAIAKGEMLLRCPRSFEAAAKYWNLSPENLAWLKEREAKFAALNTAPINESDDEEGPDEEESDEETCADCDETRNNCGCDEFAEAA